MNMTFYPTVLFVHIVSMLGLCATLSFEALMLFRLQRSRNIADAQVWSDLVPGLDRLVMISVVSILASGIYLTTVMRGWGFAWVDVALASFFAMAPLGSIFSARMRSIRRAASNGNITAQGEHGRFAPGAALRISLNVRIAALLGIVLLMTAKPGLGVSLVIMGLSAAAGFLASASGRHEQESAQTAERW
jgi:hypothetical protein